MSDPDRTHWSDRTTQQLVRYEALFKLLDEIRPLEDIAEIASRTARQWKYFANVTSWHIALAFEDSDMLIDGMRGEATVKETDEISLWDEYYLSQGLPYIVKKEEITNKMPPPEHLRHPSIVEIQILPAMRLDRCIGVLSIGARNEPFSDIDLKFIRIFGNHLVERLFDIVVRKKYLDVLLRKATNDPLTGVYNRGAILDRLKMSCELAERTKEHVSVIIIDVDHFKRVNDTYGHSAGDTVLREIARRLDLATRSADHLGRYGGEEFLIVLYPCTEEQVLIAAERFRLGIASLPCATGLPSDDRVEITISLGTATRIGDMTCETLLKHADEALYRSKKNGRNCITQF